MPLHGKGSKNDEGAPVKVLWYQRPTDPKGEWIARTLDESMHLTHNFDALQIRGFLGIQAYVIVGGKEGMKLIYPPAGNSPEFSAQFSNSPVGEVCVLGIQPNFATIEPMHGNQLVAYSKKTGERELKCERKVLTDQLIEGHALACSDVLGIGSEQIIVGWRGNPQKPQPVGIKLFTPLDAAADPWRESWIDENGMACEDLEAADLNGDGKPDIVASGRATKNLKVYLNETKR